MTAFSYQLLSWEDIAWGKSDAESANDQVEIPAYKSLILDTHVEKPPKIFCKHFCLFSASH